MPAQGVSRGIVYGAGLPTAGASLGLSVKQSVGTSTTTVALDTVEQDPNHWRSGDAIVVPTTRDYLLNGSISIVQDGGVLKALIQRNGVTVAESICQGGPGGCGTVLDTFNRTIDNSGVPYPPPSIYGPYLGTADSGQTWYADDFGFWPDGAVPEPRIAVVPGMATFGPNAPSLGGDLIGAGMDVYGLCLGSPPTDFLYEFCLPSGMNEYGGGNAWDILSINAGPVEVRFMDWGSFPVGGGGGGDGTDFGLGIAQVDTLRVTRTRPNPQLPFSAFTSPFWVRLSFIGLTPQIPGATLYGKIWSNGDPEPSAYTPMATVPGSANDDPLPNITGNPGFALDSVQIGLGTTISPILQILHVEASIGQNGQSAQTRVFKRLSLTAGDHITLAVNSSVSGTVQPTGTRLQVEPA